MKRTMKFCLTTMFAAMMVSSVGAAETVWFSTAGIGGDPAPPLPAVTVRFAISAAMAPLKLCSSGPPLALRSPRPTLILRRALLRLPSQ